MKVDVYIISITLVMLIFALWVLAYIPPSISTQKICNEHGWADGVVQYNFDRYCKRIINQTEYICPLDDVLSNSCQLDYK